MAEAKETSTQDSAKVAAFLWDLILWNLGGFVLKVSWNASIREMFPSLPYMRFGSAIGILTFVYIVARMASIGFMAEVNRNISMAFEVMSEGLKDLAESLGIKSVRVKAREEDRPSDPDMN